MINNFFRLAILSVIVLATPAMTYARTISPEAALRRVVGERSEFNTMSTDPRSHYELQYTSPEAAYYVFSAGDRGCMIVSGDDRVPALLAEIPTAWPRVRHGCLRPTGCESLRCPPTKPAHNGQRSPPPTMILRHYTPAGPTLPPSWNVHGINTRPTTCSARLRPAKGV